MEERLQSGILGARSLYNLPTVELLHPRLIIDIFHVASQQEPVDINQLHYLEIDENGNPSNPIQNMVNHTGTSSQCLFV